MSKELEPIIKKIDNLEFKLDNRLDMLHVTVEKLDTRLDSIDKTLVKNDANLENHMYRTELLEKEVSSVKLSVIPLKTHVDRIDGGLRLLGLISLVAGIFTALYQLFIK